MNDTPNNFKVTHRDGYRMVGRFKDGDFGYVEDADNKAGLKHVRRISFLERWRDTGVITKAEYAAAQNFEEDFNFAHRPANYAQNSLYRVDGGGSAKELNERVLEAQRSAKKRVCEALAAIGNRGGFIVVKCVGEGLSINAVVHPKDRGIAKGILLGALSTLTGFYGME